MKNKTVLKGSSGINIYFYTNSKGVKIVRKVSYSKKQIPRLKTQYEKHLFLSKQKNDLFRIPKIVNTGNKNGSFFYEYTYIEGSSMVQILIDKSTEELTYLLDKLSLITKYFSCQNKYFENSYKNSDFKYILKEKILDVCKKELLDEKLKEKLITKLESLKLPQIKTLSHGDLSFDNIIVDKKNNIWLIDYIGTFYPHYWLDIAKLFQDIEGGWYELKHKVKLDKSKINYLTNHLKKRVSIFDRDYLKNHNFLMSIIFLRILPYLKSKSEKKKILEKINAYIKK